MARKKSDPVIADVEALEKSLVDALALIRRLSPRVTLYADAIEAKSTKVRAVS